MTDANRFVYLKMCTNVPSFIRSIEKRQSTAALQNPSEVSARNHGHVLECGSALPLLSARFVAYRTRRFEVEDFAKYRLNLRLRIPERNNKVRRRRIS